MELKTIARKWGNSIAIIIPKSIAESKKIKENEEIVIDIKNRPFANDFFGIMPCFRVPTSELKKNMKKGW